MTTWGLERILRSHSNFSHGAFIDTDRVFLMSIFVQLLSNVCFSGYLCIVYIQNPIKSCAPSLNRHNFYHSLKHDLPPPYSPA